MSLTIRMEQENREAFLYEANNGRMAFDGWDLHCGDCFQVWDPVAHTWLDVRIELSGDRWYLTNLPEYLRKRDLSMFKARRYA